jgi:hypothetical protein
VGKRTKAITSAAAALAVGVTLVAPAAARPGPDQRAASSGGSERITIAGTCDAGSRWTVSGRSRFLRIDVAGRVEAQRQRKKPRWVLRLQQNQNTVAVRTKRGWGGLQVKARVSNQPGPDTFTLFAQNRSTGETCQGTLTF